MEKERKVERKKEEEERQKKEWEVEEKKKEGKYRQVGIVRARVKGEGGKAERKSSPL